MDHWNLGYNQHGAHYRFLKALCGYCLHSTTDNISYDASIQSQLAWNGVLRSYPNTFYLSLVGNYITDSQTPFSLLRSVVDMLLIDGERDFGTIAGLDVSQWYSEEKKRKEKYVV